jgi:hypothetical protein
MQTRINTFISPREPLSIDQIRYKAPSVFATAPHDAVTSAYRFIPTYEMLDTLTNQGWQCVQAGEHRVRNLSKRGFQKHMLRFRNPNMPKAGDSEIDLLVFNSHDRTTGFKFMAGLFRFVCANGLVAGENLFEPLSVKHVGYKSENAIEASYRVIESVPMIAESVEAMRAVTLTNDDKLAFASSALIAKFGAPDVNNPKTAIQINPSTILLPRRQAEVGKSDLWSTFNIVQENLIKGGQRTVNVKRTKRLTTRGVSSISENTKLNQALWTLAESMKQYKTA